ncbi:hypothetical protein M409DRAFT_23228 [Zasmidium cellare ATCC 36951]|uniref:Uncharacterized protein n=1 Tax=Zasmidium cellare ATCC 36951 TaxID=1080233 RepID=A0A6A6CHC9_ZASCE|nr:uncharacterized protein M409DRAFT_23228 [Zasmidium cellare ATCC 36951]KAF2166594.1 hypothetical protein M409DRAFT_23228 [Zasmidium cellare ATCC 36951]
MKSVKLSLPNFDNNSQHSSFKTSSLLTILSAISTMADTCDLRGWHEVEIVVGGGGPGQAPVSYTRQGFDLNYEGGVPIGSNDDLNPIAVNGITIPVGALGQPNEIQWDPNWALTSFNGCSATYNGATYQDPTPLQIHSPTMGPKPSTPVYIDPCASATNVGHNGTNICTLEGWHKANSIDSYTKFPTGFTLKYKCGPRIGYSETLDSTANDGITIPADALGQPGEIQWMPVFGEQFEGCSATYLGVTHNGTVSWKCGSLEAGCSMCTVEFECVDDLAGQ